LGSVIDALRPLRLDGTLRSIVHIGNDYKVVTANRQYPWPQATPLGSAPMAAMRQQLGIGYWNGSGGLYGTRAQVKEARRLVKRALAGKVDRLQFVDDKRMALMKRFATPFRIISGWDLRRVLNVLLPVYGLLKGVPTAAPLASAYWRKLQMPPVNADLDRDRCGLLWLSPVMPSSGTAATEVAQLVTHTLLQAGFEPQMSMSLATERTLTCVITISYDRDAPGDDSRALECYELLGKALMQRGYPPYRLGLAGMDALVGQAGFRDAVTAIKHALDPRGVLSPGRYEH
jgi:4-cresol dehydrogenase (hydroxylating) flavoprotein subunit